MTNEKRKYPPPQESRILSLPVIIIADNIRSLYNVGSLFRVADGVKLVAIYLCGITGHKRVKDDSRSEKVIIRCEKEIQKTGLTGVATIPFQYFEKTGDAVRTAKAKGYNVIGLERTDNSLDYRKAKYVFPLAVVLGHETKGVDDQLLKECGQVVHLPMRGEGISLNVATACGIFLYHIRAIFETNNDG